MLYGPFLTEIDSRASIKGSRDPLGIQPIWTRFGRFVVGNLTMASGSLRDFTTLLLGLHFANIASQENKSISTLEAFLKWEQLAAYARLAVNKDGTFRGIERVRARLREGSKIRISAASEDQILVSQKNYGLWGLYTIPARSSGLVEGELPQLSPAASDFVQGSYLGIIEGAELRNVARIIGLLGEPTSRIDIEGKERKLVEAIAGVLKQRLRKHEIKFYRYHLLYGGPDDTTRGRQQQLAFLLRDTYRDAGFSWSPAVVENLARRAKANGEDWAVLCSNLRNIRHSESVLAPVSCLFGYLLGLVDAEVSDVTKRLEGIWGNGLRTIDIAAVHELQDVLGGGEEETGRRWVKIADALVQGDYEGVVELLLEQNRAVMAARGGSPWIARSGNKLDIRFREEGAELPKKSALYDLWRFPYFLDSLRNIGIGIEGDLV